jgi:hypothetical protein
MPAIGNALAHRFVQERQHAQRRHELAKRRRTTHNRCRQVSSEASKTKPELVSKAADYLTSNTFRSDSVAATLTFLFYNLAQRPALVEELRAELLSLGGNFDAKALQPLPQLNSVISETLRLYPVVNLNHKTTMFTQR